MGQLSEEQKAQLRQIRERQLEVAVFPDTGRVVPEIGTRFVVTAIKENVLDFHDGPCTVVDLSLLDSDSQAAGPQPFAASYFTFGPCAHSMIKPDCPSCCRSHAMRMEDQLSKLEASTALPLRERVEKALREHVTHCYQVYKGVPPTVNDWVSGVVHYVMWGLERDIPLPPNAATAMRDKCRDVVLDYFTLTAPEMIAKYGTHIPQDAIASLTLDQVKPGEM